MCTCGTTTVDSSNSNNLISFLADSPIFAVARCRSQLRYCQVRHLASYKASMGPEVEAALTDCFDASSRAFLVRSAFEVSLAAGSRFLLGAALEWVVKATGQAG